MSSPDVMPVGDLDNWRQVFTDNFDTDVPLGDFPAQADGWGAYPYAWTDTTGHGTYNPRKVVSIVDGVLTKHIHTDAGEHMISALLPEVPGTSRHGQLYGRYAVRWRADQLPGYKIAWMLWPDSNTRIDGEIDLPEQDLDSATMSGYVHRVDTGSVAWVHTPIDTDVWHTTIIEWSPNLIVFIHDGHEILRADSGIPDTPMHWVLQTETEIDAPPPAATVEGDVQLGWVAAWQWDPTAKAPPVPRSLTLTAPATAVGTVTLSIEASPDVTQVKFMVDGAEVSWDPARPFTKQWDSRRVSNGAHQLWAKATASDGPGWFDSAHRTINVRNPLTLIAPALAAGTVLLSIVQYRWFRQCKWVVDGREVGWSSTAPFAIHWDTTRTTNGMHEIYVKVLSDRGWADGPTTTITVTN